MKRTVLALATLAALVPIVGSEAVAQEAERALEIVDAQASADEVLATVAIPPELAGAELGAEHFDVRLDGITRPAEVEKLESGLLHVVLVIDTSGSMQGAPIEAAKGAAKRFVAEMPPGALLAVTTFSSAPRVAAPFSSDPASTAGVIDLLGAGGETALYDGLVTAAAQFPAGASGRKVIVLLSDGGDTVSGASLDAARQAVVASGADLRIISLSTAETDLASLQSLIAGYGSVVAAEEPDGLTPVFAGVAAGLVHRYELRFVPPEEGGRKIDIRLEHGAVVATGSWVLSSAIPPAAPVPDPEPRLVTAPGLLGSKATLFATVGAFFGALLLVAWRLISPGEPRARVLAAEYEPAVPEHRGRLSGLRRQAAVWAERVLERSNRTRRVNALLERAGLAMRPGELVVLVSFAATGAFLAGAMVAGLGIGFGLAAVTILGFRVGLRRTASRRRAKFADQLGDTLQMLAGSLRSGYGLMQAAEGLAAEAEAPTADEFRRLVTEVRLGRTFSEAIEAMAERVANEDFRWVVHAIQIHRDVGGDLAEVLDNVGHTIRDRNRLRRQVKALSAEGRISGVILLALPFVLVLGLRLLNPEYLATLTTSPGGRVAVGIGITLMAVGAAWIRRIVTPEF